MCWPCKPGDFNLIFRTHVEVKGENQFYKVILSLWPVHVHMCSHTHKLIIIIWGLANDSSIRWLLCKHEDMISISSVHIQAGYSDTYLWSQYWKGKLKIDPWSLLANQPSGIFKLPSSVKVPACKNKIERDWGKQWTLTSGLYMHAWLCKHTHLIIGTHTQSNKHKSVVQLVCVLRQGLSVLPQAGFKFLGIGSVSTSAVSSVTWSTAHLVWATSWLVLNPDSDLEMGLCPQVLAASEMEETLCGKCALCLTHCDRQTASKCEFPPEK